MERRRLHHRELVVWQRGMELVTASYAIVGTLPAHERFALSSQIRRAALSVPANIAEGHGRLHRGDFIHHLSIANGSLRELDTLLEAASRLGYIEPQPLVPMFERIEELGRMISGLIRRLRSLPSPLSSIP